MISQHLSWTQHAAIESVWKLKLANEQRSQKLKVTDGKIVQTQSNGQTFQLVDKWFKY